MLKRRLFLSAIAAGATSAMLPVAVLGATRNSIPLSQKFAALVGSDFQFSDGVGAKSRARLVAFDAGPDCPGLEQFSVVFEGGSLAEGLYDIHHPGTGKLTVFCMPAADGGQRAYFSYFS